MSLSTTGVLLFKVMDFFDMMDLVHCMLEVLPQLQSVEKAVESRSLSPLVFHYCNLYCWLTNKGIK